MFNAFNDPFGTLLHVRFAEANGRFRTFAPRVRMAAEYFGVLDRLNAFDGIFLPKDTGPFLRANYCYRVPHHGIVHPLPMLVTAATKPFRDVTPIVTRVAIVGHDAGHNGNASESPETLGAALTVSWLQRNLDWLTAQGLCQTVRNSGHVVPDPQIATSAIMASRFPHLPGEVGLAGRWMRWYDTFRTAAGTTAPALDAALGLNGRLTRLRMLLLESFGLVDEHTPEGQDPRLRLPRWLTAGVAERFIVQQVVRDQGFVGRYYPSGTPGQDWYNPLQNRRALLRLVHGSKDIPSKQEELYELYDFFRQDITVTEFVAKCDELGIE